MRAPLAKHGRDHRLQGHDPLPNAQATFAGAASHEVLSGNTLDIEWQHSAGDAIFDYSPDDTNPTITADGVYAAWVSVGTTAAITSGYFSADVRFGSGATAPIQFFPFPCYGLPLSGSGSAIAVAVMPAWALPRGAIFNMQIANNTGSTYTFTGLTSYIQRIY